MPKLDASILNREQVIFCLLNLVLYHRPTVRVQIELESLPLQVTNQVLIRACNEAFNEAFKIQYLFNKMGNKLLHLKIHECFH